MCGIAGVIAFDDRYRPSRDTLAAMSRCIAHRGPDQEGVHLSPNGRAGLAFRRLAILDPDPRASQPFHSPDGRYTLVFNGEIYNFQSLRNELTLEHPDHCWRTTGDTEVLLLGYITWGEHCLAKLNGMYAFAVWDDRERLLFLARDRMGQKPLYYAIPDDATDAPAAIAFASELSALRSLDWLDTGLSASSLTDYLLVGYVPAPRTIYGGAAKLPPGSWMKIGAGGAITRSYFDAGAVMDSGVAFEHRRLDPVAQTRRLVETAVARQLVSDVPIGCFLSGGVDSSIIAACMKRQSVDVATFSIGFDDPRYDETPHAAAVAKHLGTKHHEFRVTPTVAADLPKLVAVFGEPFGDSSALPTHYLSRETRRHVKVALSGDGGDELFGGYERYQAMRLAERILANPLKRTVAKLPVWQWLPGAHPKSRVARFKRFQRSLALPTELRYPSYVRLFTPQDLAMLFQEQFVLRTDPALIGDRWFTTFLDHRDPVTAALAIDRVTYLPEDLLTKVDRASMLHSLEVRSPFMDHELVQFASTLSADQLLGGGTKRMLREAFAADLPREVFTRRKQGFALPIGEWFRTTLRPLLRDTLTATDSFAAQHFRPEVVTAMLDAHDAGRADHSQRLYAMLVLELWWQAQ